MYPDLSYDDKDFKGLTIKPEEKEDPDLLHDYAQRLMIKNPALIFSDIAKAGKMNDMSDEDYEQALRNIKLVSSSFFENKAYANVFHVLDRALNYILSQRDTLPESDADNEETDEEIDDEFDSYGDCVPDDLIDPFDDDDDDD